VELGRQEALVEEFAHRLDAATSGEPLDTIPFGPLELGQVRLSGELRDVARDGVLAYRIANPKATDEMQLWIRHLLLHVLRPRDPGWSSTWLGKKSAVVFSAVADASKHLLDLAGVFEEGLHRLLPLFPRTSLEYCLAPRRKLECARLVWEGNDFRDGEDVDPYLAYAWRGLDPLDAEFERLAERVMGPLVEHRSEDGS
jgi:exodeoxyribonuclease V gamma subunit